MSFNPGDKAKIKKPTFLFQGVFVHTGSAVRVAEVGDEITVDYLDREGNPMKITGLKAEDLEPVS